MIIGNGSLAKLLNDRDGALFFAAGVGDSQCNDPIKFARESNTLTSNYLLNSLKDQSLFYFSTISVNLVDTPYTRHKLNMERIVKELFEHYNIIRLGNIWECTNPNTFRNYIKAHPEAEVRDEWKYMISAEQLRLITDNLPLKGKHEISIFGEMKKVKDCL